MFRCDIPCSHRIGTVHSFPKLSESISLKLNANIDKIELDIEFQTRKIEVVERSEHDKVIAIAVKNIRRFSHFKNKAEIREFVNANMEDEEAYVFGESIALLKIISLGIHHFTEMKETRRTEFSSDDSMSDGLLDM